MRYYTPEEVRIHNCAEDCWLSIFDAVYNLTPLLQANRDNLAAPLIEAAGESITHWFDADTKDLKTYMDPKKNILMPYTPYGRFTHVPPPNPTDEVANVEKPWWKDEKYIIGRLTRKSRIIKIVNMLSKSEDVITVCSEDTISDIRDRYLEYNAHASSYTFKALIGEEYRNLDLTKTLDENSIIDETDKFISLDLDYDFYIPTLQIYYNDDLTSM